LLPIHLAVDPSPLSPVFFFSKMARSKRPLLTERDKQIAEEVAVARRQRQTALQRARRQQRRVPPPGLPSAPARPKSFDVIPEPTLPSSSSGNAMLTQDIELGSTVKYEPDHSDRDSLYQAPIMLFSPRQSDHNRTHYNNDVGGSEGNLDVGAGMRPNSAACRSRDCASSLSVSENTDSPEICQEPVLRDDRNVQQRKVQQQHEARSWRTWEETTMNHCFTLFTPKGLPRQVSRHLFLVLNMKRDQSANSCSWQGHPFSLC